MRKRTGWPRSSMSMSRLRACCSIQAVSGLLVQATYSTRRLPIVRKTSTYRRRSQTVSTVRKVAGEHRVAVLAQERAPAGAVALRRGWDAGFGEHAAHQGRRHVDAEFAQ